MGQPDFNEAVEAILGRDFRFHRDAYGFIRDALDHTQAVVLPRRQEAAPRHVSGGELLEGIREYALIQFGPMARLVLEEWGIRKCEDFGEIVFNLIDEHILSKTDQDSREDFKGGYDFTQAFSDPFRPGADPKDPTANPVR